MTDSKFAGCLLGILVGIVQLPLFMLLLYVLYGILSSINVQPWTWVIYWIYVPLCVSVNILRTIIDSLNKDTK